MTELQGVVLAGLVLISAFYVLPYIYRRRRILAQTPLDDGQSQELRILNLGDARVPTDETDTESHGGVFTGRDGVVMSKPEKKENVDIRSLARERARRRARVAKREANRTRGFIGAIVCGVLTVGLWVGTATVAVHFALPIIMTVLCAMYVGGFAYLLSVMNKANEVDLDAIDTVDVQLRDLRRSARYLAYKRASSRAGRNGGRSTREGQTHGNGREKLSHPEVMPSAFLEKHSHTGETIIDSFSSHSSMRGEQSYSVLSPVPTYTLKRSELVQRDITPYEPPAVPESDVPYRPTKLGERLDISSVRSELSSGKDASPVVQSLGGGALLDDILARRRA